MQPHGLLSGTCKHGSANFCSACDREGHPERYASTKAEPITCKNCKRKYPPYFQKCPYCKTKHVQPVKAGANG